MTERRRAAEIPDCIARCAQAYEPGGVSCATQLKQLLRKFAQSRLSGNSQFQEAVIWRMWDMVVKHLVKSDTSCDRCRPEAAKSFYIGSEVFTAVLPLVSGAVPTSSSVNAAALWLTGMLWQAQRLVSSNMRGNSHAAILAAMQARQSDEQVCAAACWALAFTLKRSCPDTEAVATAAAAMILRSLELFGDKDDLASYALRALVVLAGYTSARQLLQQRLTTSKVTIWLICRQLQSGRGSPYLDSIVSSACALIGHLCEADDLQARVSAANQLAGHRV